MALAVVLLAAFATTGTLPPGLLPPPVDLRAEWLASPALGVPAQPLLSFAAMGGERERHAHIGGFQPAHVSGRTGWELSAFRVTVRRVLGTTVTQGSPVWDSGIVQVSPSADPSVGIRVGVVLQGGSTFQWEAVYWSNSSGAGGPPVASVPAVGTFDTALTSEPDWRGATWLGAGHAEFRAYVRAPSPPF